MGSPNVMQSAQMAIAVSKFDEDPFAAEQIAMGAAKNGYRGKPELLNLYNQKVTTFLESQAQTQQQNQGTMLTGEGAPVSSPSVGDGASQGTGYQPGYQARYPGRGRA